MHDQRKNDDMCKPTGEPGEAKAPDRTGSTTSLVLAE